MSKISVIIHTASKDNFLENNGVKSYFQSVVENLKFQTFKDFEFIYVDTQYYEENKDDFKKIINKNNFKIKHVPIHENHRYWFNMNHVYISAAKNTGIIHADGELLISFDDAEFFPNDLLSKYWSYYKDGYLMHALHKRMKSIDVQNNIPLNPIDGDVYVNDYRLIELEKSNKNFKYHHHGSWTYAGTSFGLEDALKLNGFNEKMDGNKSLEDCDFGTRLIISGKKFVVDLEGFVYILEHKSYNEDKDIRDFIAVENYGILRAAVETRNYEANKRQFNKEELEIIRKETIKFRKFDPLDNTNLESLKKWLKTPNFDLRKEREELRK